MIKCICGKSTRSIEELRSDINFCFIGIYSRNSEYPNYRGEVFGIAGYCWEVLMFSRCYFSISLLDNTNVTWYGSSSQKAAEWVENVIWELKKSSS